MAAKGYCEQADVAQFLGVTFTAGQLAQCEITIERAEAFIDQYTNRAWLTGAQTDEAHYIEGRFFYLAYVPVTSVDAVTARTDLGETETALVADEDYEVRSLATGEIELTAPASWDRVLVDYTPVATVPADVKQAAIELVAHWLQPALNPGSYGLDSYSLPDLTVRFARSHVQATMPPTVAAILNGYRYPVAG